MTRQSSDAQQFCGAQFLEAADDRQYCAAQLDLARNAHQQYAYSGRRYMPERRTRGISAYAETPGPGCLAAGDGHVRGVAADVVTAVCRRRM
jgi:hypothetical protein